MLRGVGFGLVVLSLSAADAVCQTCATYPNALTNGTTADANQVMANFNCAALLGGARFTGNVGIGAAPYYNLDVAISAPGSTVTNAVRNTSASAASVAKDYIEVQGSSPLAAQIQWSDNGVGSWNAGYDIASGAFKISNDGGGTLNAVTRMTINPSGYVGVGTTAPSYLLYVNGTAYASGAAGALSDIRHKDKIKPLAAGALTVVERLRPVTFVWKNPRDDGMRGEQIGFIAQDVQKTLPDVVLVENNAEKTMGIKYTEIIPVLTAAIQEQQAEIVALKAEVAALKAK